MVSPVRSKLMDELYGHEESVRVYNLLEALDPKLNEIVQTIAYDYFWALPGLSVRDKSLVTLVSLIALKKEAQTKPHMIGFLNTGGTPENLMNVLHFLSATLGVTSIQKAFETLCDILKEKNESQTVFTDVQNYFKNLQNTSIELEKNKRDIQIANVASCAAIGDQEKTKESIKSFLTATECSETELRGTLIHLIVYCGFPVAVNGFAALKAFLEESNSSK